MGRPGSRDPTPETDVHGDHRHRDQASGKEDDELNDVRDHDGPQTPEGGVEHRDRPGYHHHHRRRRLGPTHHDHYGLGRQIDEQSHPDQARQDEDHRRRQPDPDSQTALQKLVGAGDGELHENGYEEETATDDDQRCPQQSPDQDARPVLDQLPGNRQIGNRAQQRGVERNPDDERTQAAAAQEIFLGVGLAARVVPTHAQHEGAVDGDHEPVHPPQAPEVPPLDPEQRIGGGDTDLRCGPLANRKRFQQRDLVLVSSLSQGLDGLQPLFPSAVSDVGEQFGPARRAGFLAAVHIKRAQEVDPDT